MQPSRTRQLPGFTLVELLAVIAIIGILAVAVLPTVTSLSKSAGLSSAGRLLANLLTIARSEAINRRALIRIEVATSWPLDAADAYRKLTLVQHDATTGADTQLTRWETVPAGVIFQPKAPAPANGTDFFTLNQQQTPSLSVSGKPVPTVYIEFLPTGALNVPLASSPVRLRLVEGAAGSGAGSSVVQTGANNWFDASVDALVGRIKLSRP